MSRPQVDAVTTGAIAAGVVVALFVAIFPARAAGRTQPAAVLRTE